VGDTEMNTVYLQLHLSLLWNNHLLIIMLISTELCLVMKLHIQGCKLVGLLFTPFSFPMPL